MQLEVNLFLLWCHVLELSSLAHQVFDYERLLTEVRSGNFLRKNVTYIMKFTMTSLIYLSLFCDVQVIFYFLNCGDVCFGVVLIIIVLVLASNAA